MCYWTEQEVYHRVSIKKVTCAQNMVFLSRKSHVVPLKLSHNLFEISNTCTLFYFYIFYARKY